MKLMHIHCAVKMGSAVKDKRSVLLLNPEKPTSLSRVLFRGADLKFPVFSFVGALGGILVGLECYGVE